MSLLACMAILLGCSFWLSKAHAWAQEKNSDEADKELPKPEEIDLTTDDGLEMKATYYPGTKNEESIPVLLLHSFKGNRKDYTGKDGLAEFLQKELGCAVIVPDLRGHGDSTKVRIANSKQKKDLKGKKLTPAEISSMVTEDLLTVKEFLWKRNNAKALNIDKLVVIGEEEGAAVALGYAAYDALGYDKPELGPKVGPLKLGRFVKAVVLISPSPTNIPALNTPQVMKMPVICRDMPVMIAMGNKSTPHLAEAERLRSLFVRARPPAEDDKPDSMSVWYFKKIETPLQGAKLLAEPSLKVPDKIVAFLKAWVVNNPDVKDSLWKERKQPYVD
jgi:pimeloyl-ACP methyl ester carboxylesterase